MHPLARTAILALVRRTAGGPVHNAIGRLTLSMAMGAIAALFGTAGLGLLTVALWNLLLPAIGPVWTPVALGGGMLVIASVPMLVLSHELQKRKAEEMRAADIERLVGPFLDEARTYARDNAGTTLMAAIAAGLAAGLASRD